MINDLTLILERYSGDFDNLTAYVNESVSKSIQLNGFEPENVDFSNDSGIIIRACRNGRMIGFGYDGDDVSKAAEFLENGKTLINSLPYDKYRSIPALGTPNGTLDIYDSIAETLSIADLTEVAVTTAKSALNFDKRVKSVKQSAVTSVIENSVMIQPFKAPLMSKKTYFSSMAYVIAEQGTEQDAYGNTDSVFFNDLDAVLAGREAAESACTLLNAKRLRSGRYGVLFTSAVMGEFMELIAELVNGDNLYKNVSMFSGKLGEKTASSMLTITDEPLDMRGTGSSLYDDEGQACSDIALIENGIFKSCLNNSYTSAALGIKNTANSRISSGGNSAPGYSNLKIKATTDKKPDDFMREYVKVTEVMGMHTADTISGDFSVGISGVFFRDGEPVQAFREAVLSGNLKHLLNGLVHVFDKSKTFGSVTASEALFDTMMISGE